MFVRTAGWIMKSTTTGFVSHYFRANQTKAACGVDSNLVLVTYSIRAEGVPACSRCLKASGMNRIAPVEKPKRKRRESKWGGIKDF